MKSEWYVAFFEGDQENEYERFDSDCEAVEAFAEGAMLEGQPKVLGIYECNADDECLTPVRRVYPPVIAEGLKCPQCGGPLYDSYLLEYSYQCFECDEDFYGFEAEKENLE